MEEIQLTETEQRYFGDLFVCCDSDNSGKIPIYKASELFRSANLPLDVLKQVSTERQHQENYKWYKTDVNYLFSSLDTDHAPLCSFRVHIYTYML
jgi:hypothetical protein